MKLFVLVSALILIALALIPFFIAGYAIGCVWYPLHAGIRAVRQCLDYLFEATDSEVAVIKRRIASRRPCDPLS